MVKSDYPPHSYSDLENQLDLFGEAELTPDHSPIEKDIQKTVHCLACAEADAEKPMGPDSAGCPACKGMGVRNVRLITVEGLWWDRVERTSIKADTYESACRKRGLRTDETNAGRKRIVPFVTEHGGYC